MTEGTTETRPRGIFTPKDREYLRGETEYEHYQSEINARRRIRERIYHAILDSRYLLRGVGENDIREDDSLRHLLRERPNLREDRQQIFDPRRQPRLADGEDEEGLERGPAYVDGNTGRETTNFERAIERLIAFLYIGLDERPNVGRRPFHAILGKAIERAVEQQNSILEEYDLTLEVRREISGEDLLHQFEAGEQLSDDELVWLFQNNRIDRDEFSKAIWENAPNLDDLEDPVPDPFGADDFNDEDSNGE